MYKVYAAEASNRIMTTLGLAATNNGAARNGKPSTGAADALDQKPSEVQALSDIPSISNGTLSILSAGKMGIPSFVRYMISHKLMVFHHLFIGSYGLVVIAVSLLRTYHNCRYYHYFIYCSTFAADWEIAYSASCT